MEATKMKKKLLLGAMAISLTATLLSGCGSSKVESSKSNTIKIGLAAPISGPSAEYGESFKNGTELAVKLVNDAGGIDGKKVEVVIQDDKGDPKEAVNVANQLASNKDILAVVGHFNSSATLASAPIYNKNKVVEISPSSSSPNVTDAGEYTFRVITTDAFQASYISDWSKEEGFKKVAIIYEQTDFGLGLSDVYGKSAVKNGIEVVANESYISGQTKDFSTILTKVKGKQPDAIFIGGLYNEAALIAKQAEKLGLKTKFIGVDSLFSDALIKLGGSSVEGVMLPGFFNPGGTNEKANEFAKAFKDSYAKEPDTYAAYAFDATSVVLEAIKQKGAERESIKNYLSTLKDFKAATGNLSFDENGDVMTEPQKLIVKDGKFSSYKK
jgi:branched-chain amino acid transport system substrate-binding protein